MKEAIFIVVIIGAIFLSLVARRSEERKIKERVESLGGEIVNIEYRKFFTGPFIVLNKFSSVYRFEYSQDGRVKEGWVKFGPFSSEWKLK